jgi:hypothetical protein
VRTPPPTGYRRFLVRGAEVVGRAELLDSLRSAFASGSFYEYASHHRQARALSGRGTAYAVPLPNSDVRVVVRHNRHGGLLAPLTGDRFLTPTRAPYELDVSLRLDEYGIATPQVLGYAIYHAGGILRRCDVVTREIPKSRDLSDVLVHGSEEQRDAGLVITAQLIGQLAGVGARHQDLNVKNILLAEDVDGVRAYVLDVDRVSFHAPGDVAILEQNLERFARSARKWREQRHAKISEEELGRVALLAREQLNAHLLASTRS